METLFRIFRHWGWQRVADEIRSPGVLCDVCDEAATSYCDTCKVKLGTFCLEAHTGQKETKDHILTDIETVKLSYLKITCSTCKEQAHKFCPECNLRLCTQCAGTHHKLSDISATSQQLCGEKTSDEMVNSRNQIALGVKADRNTDKKITEVKSVDSRKVCSFCAGIAGKFCPECEVQMCTRCCYSHHNLSDTLALSEHTSQQNSETRSSEENISDPALLLKGEEESIIKTKSHSAAVDISDGQGRKGNRPGMPAVEKIYTDSVDIVWTGVDNFGDGDVYQVRTENINQTNNWNNQDFKINTGKITGLEPGASYVFKVRLVKANGDESKYSNKSEAVKTHKAYASELVCTLSPVGTNRKGPDIFALPMEENEQGRNDKAMTKKYEIGSRKKQDNEKTIMFVGATGTGKSTLVDGLANYVMGVRLGDPFRFTLMADENKEKKNDQAISQTDWITTYSFNPQPGTRLSYRLNVIDTPGFGDTRGLERDHKIVDQIRHLFEAPGEMGVQTIDAVCFLIKAPDSRLTATQKYIFNAIMSLFGKDIEKNICTLITFADGSDPPVLSAVNASGLPFGKTFNFNNSALFSNPSNHFTSMFWEMGLQSFEAVINHITSLETKSIQLTKEVLQERHRLEVTISTLQLNIKEGLATTERLNSEVTLFQNNQEEIKRNSQFTYEVTETKIIKVDLPPGIHVTNCLPCNRTCHAECGIPDDDQKRNCWAIGWNGYCQQCPKKCYWNVHKNSPYKLDLVQEKVQKTYEDMKKKYEDASGKLMSLEQVLVEMEEELEAITLVIEEMVDDMRKCNNRLKEISLRPNPLGMVEQIDLLIQAEKHERKTGYQGRIEVLQQFRDRANIGGSVDEFRQQKVSVKISLKESVDSRKKKSFFSRFSK